MLLVSSDPVSAFSGTRFTLSITPGSARRFLPSFKLNTRKNRIQLREVAGGWRLFTHPAFHEQVEALVLLGHSAFHKLIETLAVVPTTSL